MAGITSNIFFTTTSIFEKRRRPSLNSNFIYESRVVKMNNQSLYYFSKSGYALVSAINGDWNSVMQQVTGIAKQGDSYIVFLQENCNVSVRFNLLWIKND